MESFNVRYPWEQSSPGVFEQQRGILDNLYHAIRGEFGQPAGFLLCSTVLFTPPAGLDEEKLASNLRVAWQLTRIRAPCIVAEFTQDGKVVNTLADQADLDRWTAATFVICHGQTAETGFAETVACPSSRLFYYPATRELNLQINHAFCDGRGLFYLWQTYFSILAEVEERPDMALRWAEEALPPLLDDILAIPPGTPQEAWPDVDKVMASIISDTAIEIPFDREASAPGEFGRQQRKLDTNTSRRIFASCKQKAITVTAAIQVASAMAVQALQRDKTGSGGSMWTGLTNIDVRRYLSGARANASKLPACHFMVLPFEIRLDDAQAWEAKAQALTKMYQDGLSDENATTLVQGLERATQLYGKYLSEGTSLTRSPWFNSLGVIEDYVAREYGAWEVNEINLSLTIQLPVVQLAVWTWRDQLVLNASYNSAYHERADIQELLARIETAATAWLDPQSSARGE